MCGIGIISSRGGLHGIPFIISFLGVLLIGSVLNGNEVNATKIVLKTRPSTYFHLPIEFSSPEIKNGPSFVKFSGGYLTGVANDSIGIYNFELVEDASVVDVELVVQREGGLCYDPTLQIFSKALTLDEKLSIAKHKEAEIRITGKSRTLEFVDKPNKGHYDHGLITTLRYQIPCQDYYSNIKSQPENEIQSSIIEIRSREKRQDKDHRYLGHNDHLGSSGDGDIEETYDDEDEEDEEDEEEIQERIVPSVPTPTFELSSSTLPFTISADEDNLIEQISSTAAEGILPTAVISSSISRGASMPPIHATPTLHPHHDLMSSSALMFENLSDAGSGDFEIRQPEHSTTSRPTPQLTEHDHAEYGGGIIDPTSSSNSEQKLPSGPIIKRKIDKIAIPAGTIMKFEIPKDAFLSENSLRFELETENGTIISKSSDSYAWIKFIADFTIAFTPSMDHISDYTFNLIAVDEKTGARTPSELLVSVRERGKSRLYNHEFELTYRKLPEGELTDFISKIVNYSRGSSSGKTDVDFILTKSESVGNIYKVKWTNESLYGGYNVNSCPVEDLSAIFKRLANPEGEPTHDFKAFVQPSHTPLELKINLLVPSHCDSVKPSNITNSSSTIQKPVVRTENFPPTIKNQVDTIEVIEGEYFILRVKDDFCYDPEDGDTKNLGLKLMDKNFVEVNESNWLQFDSKNQEFFGLPMPGADGSESYTLTCTDSGGRSDNDALVVSIATQQKTNYAAEFSLHFLSVPFTPINIRKFLTKLSTVFNDSITNIVVKNYQENVIQNTSQVHFRWFNKSDPSTEFELTELGRVLLSEAGPPNKRVLEIFGPEFQVSSGQVIPKGKMLGSGTPHHSDIGGDRSDKADDDGVTKNTANDAEPDDLYLVTYIIPSVLVFVMILLATLIACLLTRKKKAVPRSTQEETKRFIKKGVPVIFQDELEDASFNSGRGGAADMGSGSRSRSPAILREERPPLPPSYNRRSPPNIDYRNSASNQPSYQPPPPPVARTILPSATRGMRPGSGSAAINYRKPPPYVPP